jgi:hypothetical protein
MASLDSTFADLRHRLADPDSLNPTRSDPFFYFVHDPAETLEVRRRIPAWTAALENDGWSVSSVSVANLMWAEIDASGLWNEWRALEAGAELEELNEGIRDILRRGGGMVGVLREVVNQSVERGIVLITDAALLHPYFRVHLIEAALANEVRLPTVLFYPGSRDGQFGLRFLGFYPLDGGYRATLVGGNP